MGVNVTQLLNEEIKVIVEGGDNIATKTELNAGLDLKANKVVGGVFNGMDLKAAAEKLNTDKQNVIADSGWIVASLTKVGAGSRLQYRRVGDVLYIRGIVEPTGMEVENAFAELPVGYRISGNDFYAPEYETRFFGINHSASTPIRVTINTSGKIFVNVAAKLFIEITINIGRI